MTEKLMPSFRIHSSPHIELEVGCSKELLWLVLRSASLTTFRGFARLFLQGVAGPTFVDYRVCRVDTLTSRNREKVKEGMSKWAYSGILLAPLANSYMRDGVITPEISLTENLTCKLGAIQSVPAECAKSVGGDSALREEPKKPYTCMAYIQDWRGYKPSQFEKWRTNLF